MITFSSYDDIRENRPVEEVWQSDICHICCIDFGDIIACLLQSLCYSDGYTTELVSIPIILYLYTTFTKKTEIYFYLNLGISRKEYYYIPFVVEFVGFLIFITLIGYLGNAIR